MTDFSNRVKSTLGKLRKETKRKMASSEHKEASQFLEKGRKKYNTKDYKIAAKFFQKAVSADIEYAMAHYYLGLAKYKLDDSEAAIRSWNTAINLDPSSKAAVKADEKIEKHKQRANRSIDQLEDRMKNH